MKRRDLITLAGAAAALPVSARAQQSPAPRRLGVLMSIAETDIGGAQRIEAFQQAMQGLGWREGDTIHATVRWAGGQPDLIDQYARELVAQAPDVLVVSGTLAVQVVKQLTRTIPVVCALVTDPVGLGLVESLAHPGGNITGFSFIDLDLIRKWASLLKEAAPQVSRAVLPYNPRINPQYTNFLRALAAAPQSVQVEVIPTTIDSVEALRAAVTEAAQPPGGSLIIGPEAYIFDHLAEVAAIAEANRLPGISVYRKFPEVGGLMSYGPDIPDIFRRAAAYVDRILRGAKPSDLPVQQPNLFELVVNQTTALDFGIPVTSTLLARADALVN